MTTDNSKEIDEIKNELAILQKQSSALKFKLFLLEMQPLKRIIYLSNTKQYNEQLNSALKCYIKEKVDMYVLKISCGPDKYHLKDYYIFQPVQRVLDIVSKEENVYYYRGNIQEAMKIDFPILEYQNKKEIKLLEKQIDDYGESILEFYYKFDDYIYGTLYKLNLNVYSHQDIEQQDSIEVEDLYDDCERLYYFNEIKEDVIKGPIYHLLTFIDE
jgi:hypothetical protein